MRYGYTLILLQPAIMSTSSFSNILENEDFKTVAAATLISGAPPIIGLGLYAKDPSIITWWNGLKKPHWAEVNEKVYMAIDTLASLPLGCAAYLVYKNGGGLENKETARALAVFGVGVLSAYTTFYAMKIKSTKLLYYASIGVSTAGIVAAKQFHQIHPEAGRMVLPYAIWQAISVYIAHQVHTNPQNNP